MFSYRNGNYFVLLILLLAGTFSHAQSLSSQGTDFWFSFLDNANNHLSGSNNEYKLVISTKTDARINIFSSRGGSNLFTNELVAANTTRTFSISYLEARLLSSGTPDQGAIHLTSDVDVSAYALMIGGTRVEASIVLPIEMCGTDYYILSYPSMSTGNGDLPTSKSEFSIVATEDDTQIEITPSCALENGIASGAVQNITLNQGQVIQYKAAAAGDDISGTHVRVTNDKNVAVYMGHQWANINDNNYLDPLYHVGIPSDKLGNEYIYLPSIIGDDIIPLGLDNDLVRVMATEDNTSIDFGGVEPAVTLNAGEVREFNFNQITSITGDKPIMVAEFLPSTSSSSYKNCDPSFVLLNSNDQMYLKDIVFTAPSSPLTGNSFNRFSLEIITRTADINEIEMDGNPVTGFQPVPGNGDFSYVYLDISADQAVRLEAKNLACGFLAYIKGFGSAVSYAYSAGITYLDPTTQNLDISNITKPSDPVYCIGDDISFEVNGLNHTPSEIVFTIDNVEVQRGDGTQDSWNQSFTETGAHTVVIDLQFNCHPPQQITQTFEIPDYTVTPLDYRTICFGRTVTLDAVASPTAAYSYQWYYTDPATNVETAINNATNDEYTADAEGTYRVEFRDPVCDQAKSTQMELTIRPELKLEEIENIMLCPNSTSEQFDAIVSDNFGNVTYEWEYLNGSNWTEAGLPGTVSNNDQTFTTSHAHRYRVTVNDNCQSPKTEEFELQQFQDYDLSGLDLNPVVCEGAPFEVRHIEQAIVDEDLDFGFNFNWVATSGSSFTDLGDGNIDITEADSYTITIRDDNDCKTHTATVQLTFEPELLIDPITDETICETNSNSGSAQTSIDKIINITQFAGSSNVEWKIDRGNGQEDVDPASIVNSTTVQAQEKGVYTAVVKDDCTEKQQSFTIDYFAPIDLNVSNDVDECPGTSVDLSCQYEDNTLAKTVDWNNITTSNSYPSTDQISTTEEGVYEVTVSDNCYEEKEQVNVNYFEDYQFPTPQDEYTICGDETQSISDVTVNPVPSDNPIYYDWAHVDGDQNEAEITLTEAGRHQLTIYDKEGCKSQTFDIDVIHAPELVFDGVYPDSLCEGGEETLVISNDSKVVSYYVNEQLVTDRNFTVTDEGTYDLRIIDQYDCEYESSHTLAHYPKPQLDDWSGTICDDEFPFYLRAQNTNSATSKYLWSTGETGPSARVDEKGDYTLTVEHAHCNDPNYDYQITRDYSLEDKACRYFIYIPNSFSPEFADEDINKRFGPVLDWGQVISCTMSIYNRWGELMYQSEVRGESDYWDGTYNGKVCTGDSYVYRIDVTFYNERVNAPETKPAYSGHVNLLR